MALVLIPAIHRATHQIGLAIRGARRLGVNQAEAHILAHLHDYGETSIDSLHRAFGHRRSTLTSILDRLTARRLITRDVNRHDRRSFVVRLTRSGEALAAQIAKLLAGLEGDATSGMSASARQAVLQVLGRFDHRRR
jgi:DNA-binding MarR family transcriptional regulator